jgi:hypothetical protein
MVELAVACMIRQADDGKDGAGHGRLNRRKKPDDMKAPKFYRRYDYAKSLLPNDFLASLENGVADIEAARSRTGFTIGYPGWNLIYYAMLSHLHPTAFNLVLETGTNWGCTTIILGQALKDSGGQGQVITVEINPDHHARAVDNLRRAGVMDVVTARLGDSKLLLKEIAAAGTPVRCALLDASHLFADVIDEFETVYPLLAPESIVIFDNTYQIAEDHEDQRVYGALRYIKYRFGGNVVNFEFASWHTPGVAIWQKSAT